MSDNSPSVNRARFTVRLREAGLGTERFIDVEDGTKTSNDHTQREPDSENLSGNYGVYPGRGGGDGGYLIDIDVDDYNEVDELALSELNALPDTFGVESPHGGDHRYYAVDGDPPAAMKEEFGIRNPVPTWGEIRIENGYVVGPGSELDGCSKEWCDECEKPESGQYRISANRPIAEIDIDDLVEVVSADVNYYEEYEQMTFGNND
jgi:putative DNA primase/helicase